VSPINIDKFDICLISTKTSLFQFFRAVDEVSKEIGIELNTKVFYTHELDEAVEERFKEFRECVKNADIVLIDVRSGISKFLRELSTLLGESRARVVIPLVGGTTVMSFLRLGSISGERFSRVEYDFDTQYLDMSRVWKIMDTIKTMGRVIPLGSIRDWRNYVLLTEYWAYHGVRNLKNMIKLILKEYFLVKNINYEDPVVEVRELSIYDPILGFFNSIEDYIKISNLNLSNPTIAILLYAGMHFEQSRVVAGELYRRFREKGLNVILIVGGSAKSLSTQLKALERFCFFHGKPLVDAIVNLQWFQINGGPYGGPVEPTWTLLSSINAPLFNGLIMYMREVSKWEKDPRGISLIEVLTGVALPEIDGAIEPIPLAGLDDSYAKEIKVIEDRIARRIIRIENWINLRKTRNSEKRIAIIIYNYPPGEHNVGSAAYLDVFSSLESLLKKLKEEEYSVEPLDKEKLKEFIGKILVNSPRTFEYQSNATSISLKEYIQYFNSLPSKLRDTVVRVWGPPPGEINVIGDRIIIPGIVLGNIFIGVQPSRGIHEEHDKLYHSKDLPPHHQYIAFYYWIEKVFRANAVIHLGTHGTLEFMPGKEVGLSKNCWPDILIGDIPNIYIYHVTNPSEMTIAKRRGYAYIITHGTPPFTKSDLYGEYIEFEELIREYIETEDIERKEIVRRLIDEKCRKLHLEFTSIEELHDKLFELKRSIVPKGLHVIGTKWSFDEIIDYLTFILRYDHDVKSLHKILAEARGFNYDELLEKPSSIVNGRRASEILKEIEEEARTLVRQVVYGKDIDILIKQYPRSVREEFRKTLSYTHNLYIRIISSDELNAVIRALKGEHILPRVAGDPIRTPEIFPTGSHGYAFDPRLIPSKAAYLRGARIAEDILRMYRERYERYPESIGIVLWGFETAGTRGETIGQILQLLGVRLVRKQGPWSWDLEVIPLEELKRPRIDVVITICGIFRDMFPHLIMLIDRAIKLVASLDEPLEMNYVRKHYIKLHKKFGDRATIRIFGPKDGTYATRLTEFIETSAWKSEEELAEIYIDDMGYGYGENIQAVLLKELFKELIMEVDLVTQIRYAHEYEITDLDHYYEFLGGLLNVIRKSGRKADGIWIDTTTERIRYRGIAEAIDHAIRTRILNPKWVEGMLKHGYDGVREIAKRIEYILGLTATTGEVPNWVFDEIAKYYVFNKEIKERMLHENKWAYYEILKRLYEAYIRGYWKTEKEVIDRIKEEAAIYEE